VYFPTAIAETKTPLPVIIFSHGLAASRESYAPYGEAWAAAGYIVIHPTHVGSDTSIVTAGNGNTLTQNLMNGISVETALRRVEDVSFILDQMEKINAGTVEGKDLAPFKGHVDMKHVGMAGHSFGAETTLVVSGQTAKVGPVERSKPEPRITAAIALS